MLVLSRVGGMNYKMMGLGVNLEIDFAGRRMQSY